MPRPLLRVRPTVSGAVAICLAIIALGFTTAFDFAPMKSSKMRSILRSVPFGPKQSYYAHVYSQLAYDAGGLESNKVVAWSFSRGVPGGWSATDLEKISVRGRRGVTVWTTPKNFQQQLRSPAVSLGRGYYDVIVEGTVARGGLALGAQRGLACLGNSFFWAGQWRGQSGAKLMVRRLRVPVHDVLHFVLSNWSYPDAPSLWGIKRVFVRRLSFFELPQVRATFARPATRLVTRGAAMADTATVHVWDFKGRLASGWSNESPTTVVSTKTATAVRTSRKNFRYALSSGPIMLDKGSYSVVIDGAVARGGLEIGVITLSEERERFITSKVFWFGQDFAAKLARAKFSIEVPSTIRIVLANWNPYDQYSLWMLRRMHLVVNLRD